MKKTDVKKIARLSLSIISLAIYFCIMQHCIFCTLTWNLSSRLKILILLLQIFIFASIFGTISLFGFDWLHFDFCFHKTKNLQIGQLFFRNNETKFK